MIDCYQNHCMCKLCLNQKTFQTPNRKQTHNTTKTRLLFQSPLMCSTTATTKMSKPLMHLSDAGRRTSSLMRRSVSTTILNETATKFIDPSELISTPVSGTLTQEFTQPKPSVKRHDLTTGVTEIVVEKKTLENSICLKDNDKTSIVFGISSDIKSRYKSEPNLSRILTDHNMSSTPIHSNHTKYSLANQFSNDSNKLSKGVSLDNLKWATSCTDLLSAAILLKNNESKLSSKETSILDDPDFEATPNSESSFDCQTNEIYTPIMVGIGRESMSPIRQATKRMTLAMQVWFHACLCFIS